MLNHAVEPCETLLVAPSADAAFTALQQQVVASWVRANTSHCTWDSFMQGLGLTADTAVIDDSYDPVVFGRALIDAIFNEGVIEALRAQIELGLPAIPGPAV